MKLELPQHIVNSNYNKINTSYGSSGIVVSNPRTPLNSETCDQVLQLDEVAKLFFNENEYNYEISKYVQLSQLLDHSMFLFNKSSGLTNKNEIDIYSSQVYNSKWYDCGLCMYDIYSINQYLDYKNFITSSKIYQIVFDKMIVLDKIDFDQDRFDLLICNLTEIIQSLHSINLYIDDLKPDNIVYNPKTNRFMLIDLVSIVSVQEVLEFKSTWTKNIFSINDPFVLYTLNSSKFKSRCYQESNNFELQLDFYWDLINLSNLNKFKNKFGSNIDWLLKFSNKFSLGLLLVKLGCDKGFNYIRSCADIVSKL
jgi:serine/threonine protein kinase